MENYKAITDRISELANNPEVLGQHIQNHIAGITHTLPNISQGVSTTIAAGVNHLASKIPQQPVNMPMSTEWEPSVVHKQNFHEHYNAVNDPTIALKQIKDGELSSQTMESLQAVHPELLNEMRTKLESQMSPEKARALPFQTQQSIAMFLGKPMDSSMLPAVRASNQAAYANPAPSQMQTGPGQAKSTQGGLSKLNVASQYKTEISQETKDA